MDSVGTSDTRITPTNSIEECCSGSDPQSPPSPPKKKHSKKRHTKRELFPAVKWTCEASCPHLNFLSSLEFNQSRKAFIEDPTLRYKLPLYFEKVDQVASQLGNMMYDCYPFHSSNLCVRPECYNPTSFDPEKVSEEELSRISPFLYYVFCDQCIADFPVRRQLAFCTWCMGQVNRRGNVCKGNIKVAKMRIDLAKPKDGK